MSENTTQPPEEAPPLSLDEAVESLERLFKHVVGHRIRYDEIGAQNLVGAGTWMDLIQLGRTEYLRELGLTLEGGSAPIQIVVRHTSVEHFAPAHFDELMMIKTRCSYLGNSSARFETLIDSADGLRFLVADSAVVCVEVSGFSSVSWPGVFRERVQAHEEDRLQIGQLIK